MLGEKHYNADGTPTVAWQSSLDALERRLNAAEAKLAVIAAVAAPTGGATTDAEARAAINAIISGAS